MTTHINGMIADFGAQKEASTASELRRFPTLAKVFLGSWRIIKGIGEKMKFPKMFAFQGI